MGLLLLAHTWQGVTRRAALPEHERPDSAAYVDECHNFLNLPGSVSDILAKARGYRLSLVLAHQHLSPLPKDLCDAVSADARNKIYFAASPEDAGDLARHENEQARHQQDRATATRPTRRAPSHRRGPVTVKKTIRQRRTASTPRRATPELFLELRARFTDRDQAILELVWEHRVLTTTHQLAAIFFTTPGKARDRLL
jgi:hypothetical protein